MTSVLYVAMCVLCFFVDIAWGIGRIILLALCAGIWGVSVPGHGTVHDPVHARHVRAVGELIRA